MSTTLKQEGFASDAGYVNSGRTYSISRRMIVGYLTEDTTLALNV